MYFFEGYNSSQHFLCAWRHIFEWLEFLLEQKHNPATMFWVLLSLKTCRIIQFLHFHLQVILHLLHTGSGTGLPPVFWYAINVVFHVFGNCIQFWKENARVLKKKCISMKFCAYTVFEWMCGRSACEACLIKFHTRWSVRLRIGAPILPLSHRQPWYWWDVIWVGVSRLSWEASGFYLIVSLR